MGCAGGVLVDDLGEGFVGDAVVVVWVGGEVVVEGFGGGFDVEGFAGFGGVEVVEGLGEFGDGGVHGVCSLVGLCVVGGGVFGVLGVEGL